MITDKQENFSQAVASGMTQADAYRSAYNASAMKAETVQKRASELMRNGVIAGRVAELKDELAEKALWTREQSVAVLVGVIGDGESRAGDKISAVKVLNDMQGFNAPTKLDVAVTFPRVINVISGRT